MAKQANFESVYIQEPQRTQVPLHWFVEPHRIHPDHREIADASMPAVMQTPVKGRRKRGSDDRRVRTHRAAALREDQEPKRWPFGWQAMCPADDAQNQSNE